MRKELFKICKKKEEEIRYHDLNRKLEGFSGSTVVKNLLANAGDSGDWS